MDNATGRKGIFAGEAPLPILTRWLAEATETEPNDPNAMALATVDPDGMPNVRMVLLKDIGADSVTFYTNYGSAKGQELDASGKVALVLHWKSLRRQVRLRGTVERADGPEADAYFASRSLQSRLGAWASEQSRLLSSREHLMAEVARLTPKLGLNPPRPPHWGGYRISPLEMEFWADGAFRLHDRFRWTRATLKDDWTVVRLNP
ncbi:pyridoxamine 5'-phosphate oxidase [Oceanomicrobium pacificus]|uniref:Pyridoxine/pyridoxamine 5'-phosphate oxidase n=1 Tax=Oceanomicrobium pacificus TaxID=2692916 RepID=A0A6B0TXG3_9RHOB|nr:pyridoxamine 5'-phosphate oxidase [Oceanomicrobium pacificus]MXU66168.1 pyridoxamine 5'-phosphate oxidase [Oceanomicrobium pacificus]